MKLILKFILLLLVVDAIYAASQNESTIPSLQNGDLVFQTTWTNQTLATMAASYSLYTHTGIIKETAEGPLVIEAGKVVRETKLHDWINGGIAHRFAVYRYEGLTPEQGQK